MPDQNIVRPGQDADCEATVNPVDFPMGRKILGRMTENCSKITSDNRKRKPSELKKMHG